MWHVQNSVRFKNFVPKFLNLILFTILEAPDVAHVTHGWSNTEVLGPVGP